MTRKIKNGVTVITSTDKSMQIVAFFEGSRISKKGKITLELVSLKHLRIYLRRKNNECTIIIPA